MMTFKRPEPRLGYAPSRFDSDRLKPWDHTYPEKCDFSQGKVTRISDNKEVATILGSFNVSDLEKAKELVAENPGARIYVIKKDPKPYVEGIILKDLSGHTTYMNRYITPDMTPNIKIKETPLAGSCLYVINPLNKDGAKVGHVPEDLELI